MSVLDAVFERPGIYRWDGTIDAALWAEALRRDDLWVVAVDGARATSKVQTLDAFAEALRFPDWFGRNLDALADLLAGLTVVTVVIWDGWGRVAADDPDGFAGILEVLVERAEQPDFTVLLHGPGPDVSLPVALPVLEP